ncbi:hypothetical protein D3C81_1976850 [compost metagenome]
MGLPAIQQPRQQRLLDAAVAPVRQQLCHGQGVIERAAPASVVHRAAVVGVDQAEIPVLIALIKVWHAGHGAAQQGLDQAIEGSGGGDQLRRVGHGLA